MWKNKVLEFLIGKKSTSYLNVEDSCAGLMFKVWYEEKANNTHDWYDYTKNYRKYMSRTNFALKQLLKEDKIELSDTKTLKGGKIYKHKKPLLKYKFNVERYATSDN